MVYRGSGTSLRIALWAFAATAICMMAAALILMVLPRPHTRFHYLVAGTAPAIAGLLALLARTQRERTRSRSRWLERRGESRTEAV